jgi:ribosomal protein S15
MKCSTCLFSTTPQAHFVGKNKKTRRRVDPYRAAQARQRKSANLARQGVLQKERLAAMGDPIRSEPTDFLQELLTLQSSKPLEPGLQEEPEVRPLNHSISQQLYDNTIVRSRWLTEPLPNENEDTRDPIAEEQAQKKHAELDENARRALSTIMSLDNGNSKDRTRVKIQKCIEVFGRHKTDTHLRPKPQSSDLHIRVIDLNDKRTILQNSNGSKFALPGRGGPDTGSSEVQAAILTAKINVLADNLYKHDKHNKRNLRLLVHKRQKHLAYLRKKERGGPRWQHLVEKLGISDAMWKGEISL